jgi:hypothetical protein
MTTTTNKPEKSFRFGHIEVSVWKREGSNGEQFYSASASRNFINKEGQWRRTSSFATDEIPAVIEQLRQALAYMQGAERPTLG